MSRVQRPADAGSTARLACSQTASWRTPRVALAWGAYFQDPSLPGTLLALSASVALWLTATTDERECLAYFGPEYAAYMQRTKRFIPFLL